MSDACLLATPHVVEGSEKIICEKYYKEAVKGTVSTHTADNVKRVRPCPVS
jgi:hypothetical protein